MLLEKAKIYGVDGVGKSSPSLTRTDSAEGLTFTVGASEIKSDFDKCYPWCEMQEVVDEHDNVFIKIPKFYSKITKNADGTFKHQISGFRFDGFSTLFVDGKGNEIDYVLVGKYEASGSSSQAFSKSGQTCLVSITLPNMRKACAANGEGYQQYDFLIDAIIKELFMIEFATTNSQSIMQGWTNGSNTAALITGHTDNVKTASGSWNTNHTEDCATCNSDGLHACKYRGIENPWGNVWKWCDGITFSKEKIYVCTDPTKYVSESQAQPYNYVGDRKTGEGYLKTIEYFDRFPLLGFAKETGASSSTHYSDYYYYNENGTVLSVGGFWNAGAYAGLWYWSGYYSASLAYARIGGRLCYKPL